MPDFKEIIRYIESIKDETLLKEIKNAIRGKIMPDLKEIIRYIESIKDETLLKEIENAITRRKRELERNNKEELEFSFEATNDPRKGVPFVARLLYEDGKIEREFYEFDKQWGRKSVTVSGKYKAKVGDIIEIRRGGSWRNDYRDWYLVTPEGLTYVANIDDSKEKMKVQKYLKGEISYEELLKSAREENETENVKININQNKKDSSNDIDR